MSHTENENFHDELSSTESAVTREDPLADASQVRERPGDNNKLSIAKIMLANGFASKVGRRAPTARYIKAQGKREARRPGFTTSTRDRGLKGRNTQGITPFQGWNV